MIVAGLAVGFGAFQDRMTVNGGLGWDGEFYYTIAEQF